MIFMTIMYTRISGSVSKLVLSFEIRRQSNGMCCFYLTWPSGTGPSKFGATSAGNRDS